MAYQSTVDDIARDTNSFYRRTLHVLNEARVPFLVGGSHAFLHYTGIVRSTKDFDLFVRREDCDRALDVLADAGYRTDLTFPHWLAKAFQGNDIVDLVFSSGNGICRVDDSWFGHAVEAEVLGMPVKIAPVMERERYDGADVVHLLRSCTERLDWNRLLLRFDANWELLLAHLVFFGFVYPSERHRLPRDVLNDLLTRSQQQLDTPRSDDRACRGTLVSRAQFLLDIGLYGYEDARLVPRGHMTPEDAIYWTWAIEHVD
jgi:hypothetical protein